MSVIAGLFAAFKAYWWSYDLSMWSSFRSTDSAIKKVKEELKKAPLFSGKYIFMSNSS